jgi:hypothetical protein
MEKVENPDPSCDSLHSIHVGIAIEGLELLEKLCILLIFPGLCHLCFRFMERSLERANEGKCVREVLPHRE